VLKYKNNMTKILIVGSCIGLVFLAKLSVVFIIIGAPVLFFLFFKRKELKWFILSSCLGLAVFLLVWWVLSIISTVSFTSPIEYILLNFVNKGGASISDKIVTILYAGLKQNLLWITLPASLLFISQLKNKRTQLFGVICIIA
ncbi:MAG: hypothetical protein NTY48_04215, partial [Candidatus Diapherotrites archaeon]|nr:hypothetical protein [Candidatus Diapherotrites archaeon]